MLHLVQEWLLRAWGLFWQYLPLYVQESIWPGYDVTIQKLPGCLFFADQSWPGWRRWSNTTKERIRYCIFPMHSKHDYLPYEWSRNLKPNVHSATGEQNQAVCNSLSRRRDRVEKKNQWLSCWLGKEGIKRRMVTLINSLDTLATLPLRLSANQKLMHNTRSLWYVFVNLLMKSCFMKLSIGGK